MNTLSKIFLSLSFAALIGVSCEASSDAPASVAPEKPMVEKNKDHKDEKKSKKHHKRKKHKHHKHKEKENHKHEKESQK